MRTSIIGLTVVFVLGLFASPLLADGQQAGKVYRIGYLAYEAAHGPRDEAFRQALRELGWVEGENITIEYRWSAGKRDRLHAMIEELVRLPVDLMVVASGRVVRLPVQRPAKFNLTVNLKTAKQLGITIPPLILYQATEVIQ